MNNSLPPSTDAAPAELIQLGHYELHDCIGRGGMGLVYRARDTRLDRQVAIKCLRTELFEHHYVERFKREALLLAKLNHPNIVQIYDFIEAPDQLALVMELVEGQNLQLHLREHIVPFAQRMRWLTEIAQGLAVAHDAGIIHRDLKAENILINQRNVAKITDLGIAKSQDYNATLTDHVAGSYCSMSPEQAMGEAIDFKSDLFSFGILAYQLLCSAHPFGDTNNKLQLMQRIISHPPIAPSKHNPNLPAEINDLLGQLLSKDPAKRPDNTHWVAAQFEALSQLQLENDFVSDDTQALIPNGSAANQSNVKNTGINRAVKTQDHPTFETRFVAVNTAPKKSRWLPIKNYLLENKISVSFGLFSVSLLAAVAAWQLQPKPPKYIAVIPPKLTAEGMQESQQELVKGAVYDAIQQSVIQLDGYYLIPQNEIADVNGDNETVRRATAADELITTEIKCKVEACTITLARLTPETEKSGSRLRVNDTKKIDLLTDNYSSLSSIVQTNIGGIYSKDISNIFAVIDPEEYATFLSANQSSRKYGARADHLDKLDNLSTATNSLSAIQVLYRETALELYSESQDEKYLDRLEQYMQKRPEPHEFGKLNNLYRLQVAKGNIENANKILDELKKINSSESLIFELEAYTNMATHNYDQAAELYKKAYSIKTTANNAYNIANAYWYQGKTALAKENLHKSLTIAPESYKSHSLLGLIALVDGDIQQAIKHFEKNVMQKPDDNANINNLGLCYLLIKKYEKSIELFSHASTLAPQNTTYQLNKADALNLSGNQTESNKIYQSIITNLATQKPNGTNLRSIAQAYAHLGDYSKALTHLKALERTDPQNIESIYTAALIHTLTGNTQSAILHIEESLKAGMNTVWFNFAWFNTLCREQKIIDIFTAYGEPHQCGSPDLTISPL